jgi:arabinan endo-1,5-alpha-L-arabinosidase
VGRSRKVQGPYLDHTETEILQGGGTPVLEGDKRMFKAVGHCAAYHFGDKNRFICHGYYLPWGGTSILVNKELKWPTD